MKIIANVLFCVGLIVAAMAARAEVQVPAGDLGVAVETLAKQANVNVLYAGDLLEGRRTAGVAGEFSARDAFVRLLEGTSLTVTEERGGLRIAQAAAPAPRVAEPFSDAAKPQSDLAPVSWKRRELQIPCKDCDLGDEIRKVLRRLGATEISAAPDSATFLSLAASAAAADSSPSPMQAHWETVSFALDKRWPRDVGFGIDQTVYESLQTHILPLFIHRNFREIMRVISVDVLVAGPLSASDSVCHRVSQASGTVIQRYCGKPDQWQALEARVGFSCRNEGQKNELCASATEWKGWGLTRATRVYVDNARWNDQAASEIASRSSGYTFTGPTVGAPVSAPAPEPAPAPTTP